MLAARVDLALFEPLGFGIRALGFLFAAAITLGIARALFLTGLALFSAWKERRQARPEIDPETFVSVLIPAFNEERVIERSVAQVLASENVQLEIIVIDDGSKDRTSEIVEQAFGDDPRVHLIKLENGGKARALNHGLAIAKSDIVIALDADTQFEPNTIARLARWFATDERLAAVAGNAKVGNRINIVTKWQALEYVTAQNLERRALARLGAMTVVPGAVGAWRKQAIVEVGGYPPDTLAEDQDLTIAVQRAGWRVAYDQGAIAWTEAPQTFAATRAPALPLGVRDDPMRVEAQKDPCRWLAARAGVRRTSPNDLVSAAICYGFADHRSCAGREHLRDSHLDS